MQRTIARLGVFLPLMVAVVAALPLFGARFIPTHDGEYHIIRFWQFFTMLSHGYLFPRWAPDLNSGFGIPLFNFNYPFPNYIGSFFHLTGLSFVDAVKWTLALGYLSAVLWCYVLTKKLFGTKAAVGATVIFSFVPYWFVDLYVRGSVGEVWAISFFLLTLTLLAYRRTLLAAFAIAGLILSHNILSILFVPIVVVFMLAFEKKQWPALLLGIGLTTYFWLPALLERGFVVGLNSVNYQDHFPALFQLLIPSWGTGFSGPGIGASEMSFQIGIVSLGIAIISALFLFKKDDGGIKRLMVGSFLVYILAIFFMTDFSQGVWAVAAPIMGYLQYPWRLLSVTLVATPILAAYVLKRIPFWISCILAAFSVAVAVSYARPVTYEPRSDAYYLTKPNFTDGTSSLGNIFSPKWSTWQQVRPQKRFEIINGTGTITETSITPVVFEGNVMAETVIYVRANIAYYPGWKAFVDGREQPIDYQDGFVRIAISRGEHQLIVHFTETPLRRLADVISLASLLWLMGSAILIKGKSVNSHTYAHSDKLISIDKRTQTAGDRRIHR